MCTEMGCVCHILCAFPVCPMVGWERGKTHLLRPAKNKAFPEAVLVLLEHVDGVSLLRKRRAKGAVWHGVRPRRTWGQGKRRER